MKNGDPHLNTSHPSGINAMDAGRPRVSSLWEKDAPAQDSPTNFYLTGAARMREGHGPLSPHHSGAGAGGLGGSGSFGPTRRLPPLNPDTASVSLARELSYTLSSTSTSGQSPRAGSRLTGRQPRTAGAAAPRGGGGRRR
jgi:hypothetical protein